jgi:uncharacterized protein
MSTNIIGRNEEIKILKKCVDAKKAHFVVVYGRRRIGKTYLIKEYFNHQFTFYASGVANKNKSSQLAAFNLQLANMPGYNELTDEPDTWLEAFNLLIKLLKKSKDEKKVIFLDELPWMDTKNSDFIAGLDYFWNTWASTQEHLILIGCGSAASWMISKLINAKGGLHNRVTTKIKLSPFTLLETEQFMISRGHQLTRYHIVQLYMALGGVAYYLEQCLPEYSPTQNIEHIFFCENALLQNEFNILFKSLFDASDNHMQIVTALAKKKQGLTRKTLLELTKLPDGGAFTKHLKELEESNFIKRYKKFGQKSRETTFQLVDNFTLFYCKFLDYISSDKENVWINLTNTPEYYTWAGNAFEIIGLQHISQIKSALSIGGIQSEVFSWHNEKAQIDLIIDRKDQVINLIEMKFSVNPYTLDKKYVDNLRNKMAQFIDYTKTRKAVWVVMLTTFGLSGGKYNSDVQGSLNLEDLFR